MISFDRAADRYDATRGLPEREMAPLVRAIAAELAESGRVLDVAVGTGRFAAPLTDAGLEVVGADVSRTMMGKARLKGVLDLVQADVTFLPMKSKSVDSALICHVLHLVEDPAKVLREVSRVTSRSILALIDRPADVTLRRVYARVLAEEGIPGRVLLGGESQLEERVPASKLVRVAGLEGSVDQVNHMERYAKREPAITWDVPEATHRRAVSEMADVVAKGPRYSSFGYEIAVWTPEQLTSVSNEQLRG